MTTNNENSGQGNSSNDFNGEPLSFDEILSDKEYQAEFDRRLQKAIATNTAKLEETYTEQINAVKDGTIKIEEVDERIKAEKQQMQKELDEIKVNSALKLALAKSGTIDEVALKAHLNLDDVKLAEDGSLEGIDKQLSTLKEDKAYLFGEQRNTGLPHGKPPAKLTDEEVVNKALGLK